MGLAPDRDGSRETLETPVGEDQEATATVLRPASILTFPRRSRGFDAAVNVVRSIASRLETGSLPGAEACSAL